MITNRSVLFSKFIIFIDTIGAAEAKCWVRRCVLKFFSQTELRCLKQVHLGRLAFASSGLHDFYFGDKLGDLAVLKRFESTLQGVVVLSRADGTSAWLIAFLVVNQRESQERLLLMFKFLELIQLWHWRNKLGCGSGHLLETDLLSQRMIGYF
jgi:hypothetical protein